MFATFEGIEGAGKTTIIQRLGAWCAKNSLPTVITREPGGTELGKTLRKSLLDRATVNLVPRAELFLFMADRAQHVAEVIMPALANHQIVLCDRYTDSTMAYQGNGRGLLPGDLENLNLVATSGLIPDITFLLDLPVKTGLERALKRNQLLGTEASEGRFDAETLEFHQRIREGFLTIAKKFPQRIKIINADQSVDKVFRDCLSQFESTLAKIHIT